MESDNVDNRKMKTNRIVPSECLINNILDKDLQSVLFPLSIFQSLYLISKYSIIDNFITPKTPIWQFISSVIGATVLVCCHFYRHFFYYNSLDNFRSPVITFLLYFDLVFFTIVSIITHVISALQNENTVELIIKLQNFLNSIIIDKKSFLYKCKIENWLSVCYVVLIHVVLWLSFVDVNLGFSGALSSFILTVPTMIFDLHIVNATRTVVFIKNELVAWNAILEGRKKVNIKAEEEIRNDEISGSVMFHAYIDVLRAFRLCHKVYQFAVAYFGFQTFIHILVNLEVVIELGKLSGQDTFFQYLYIRILSAVWNLKNFGLLVTLSIACENFYNIVKVAEGTCAQLLCSDQTTDMRRTCKNVLRVNRAALRKLSAYGIFEVDGVYPLRMLSGLVSYTVVLLQFAFL